MKQALVILGRYPKPGFVKTRLAREIGEEAAAKFYKECAEHVFSQVDKLQLDTYFLYPKEEDQQLIKKWVGEKYKLISPETDNINENLKKTFANLFKKNYQKIICLATDLPDVTSEIISDAFEKLEKNDIVIGPDNDGGIYLFGQKKNNEKIFYISGDRTIFDQVVSNLKKEEMSLYKLQELVDVDTLADLNFWLTHKDQPDSGGEQKQTD